MAPETETVIAAETVTVHDESMGFDRRLVAGLEVPADLVDAYRAKVGDKEAPPAKKPTAKKSASADED